ncbi:hypothetical protein [Chryseobacterium gambrini]|uniref:Uncharacterized protein n=1 Tax=Chryseobacterium gambrini TaxID=373672 RepID=A0A1N7ME71_9FLAO|nr:hypothetical protein [Chryseobacterium gambrini]SIS84320.1 hypothetical protein SAMN05421785_103154 [Chryseobacterium gambrini]
MSKIKLLINEVFRKAKEDTGKTTKNGLATYLWSYLDEREPRCINERTLSRYYEAFVLGTREEINPDIATLNRLSKYVGFNDFADFSNTFIKKDEEVNKTTVKITVDDDENSLTEKISKIIINITNEQYFKVPDFVKKNGLGIIEMVFVLLLATGGVVFSNNKNSKVSGFMSAWGTPAVDKKYMYWDKDRYMATDSSYLGPQIEVIPMEKKLFIYFRRITRPDTLNSENSIGKIWYDKTDNHVEFFTSFGRHPENGKALKDVTEHILGNYAGENAILEEEE